MKVIKISEVESFIPPGHTKMSSKLFINSFIGAKHLQIGYQTMEEGGDAEIHTHPNSEQVIFVLEGKLMFKTDEKETGLNPGTAVFIPAGEPHATRNIGPGRAIYLIVTSPPI